ncbi:MAG: hypothetical protein ACFFC7_21825 [Candidatus Hermodarchaeota archaeon]
MRNEIIPVIIAEIATFLDVIGIQYTAIISLKTSFYLFPLTLCVKLSFEE